MSTNRVGAIVVPWLIFHTDCLGVSAAFSFSHCLKEVQQNLPSNSKQKTSGSEEMGKGFSVFGLITPF